MSGTKRLRDGRHLLPIYRNDPKVGLLFKPVQEAHSHWEGNWYQWPKHYPVAYFDPDGYVIFASEKELLAHVPPGDTTHFSVVLRKLTMWQPLTPPPKSFKR